MMKSFYGTKQDQDPSSHHYRTGQEQSALQSSGQLLSSGQAYQHRHSGTSSAGLQVWLSAANTLPSLHPNLFGS